jgi:glycosyltransferase involved in cell wall biosynthesis
MRVLILTPFPPEGVGGAETFVKALIKEASKENEITLCTLKIRHGKPWQGTSLKNMVSVFPKMAVSSFILCCSKSFQIIHAQGLIAGLVAVLLKKIFRTKAYITLLALYDFDGKGLVSKVSKFVLNNCDIIFVEGINGKKEVESLIGSHICIRTFNHWCDQETFKPLRERPVEKIRVLFIGRPIPEKGKHIIEGAERILNNPKYEFVYVENMPYEKLPELYQSCHICCCPSLYSEGMTRVVTEAACCGCAVITSNCGSLPEQVAGWGLAIEPTPENFAKAIEHVAQYIHMYTENSIYHASRNYRSAEVFLEEYR